MVPQVFISHPKEDKELAGAVTDLLVRGCGLATSQVVCSSKPGARIPAGADFKEYMRERLAQTNLLLQLITPAYLDSVFCMFELGAAWVQRIDTFPLVVPPLTFENLDAITGGVEARRLDDRSGLDELFQHVTREAGSAADLQRWNRERAKFLRSVRRKSASVSAPRKVTMSEYSSLSAQLDQAVRLARYADCMAPLSELFEQVRDAYYFLQDVEPDNFPDEFILKTMSEAVRHIAAVFSKTTGVSCRAVIKWLDEPPEMPLAIDQWPVRDLVRSDRRGRTTAAPDFVGNNTDYREIVERRREVFVGNDLTAMFLAGDYENSHWTEVVVRADRIDYRAAIVAPIGRFLEDRQMAAALGTDAVAQDVVGFLCLDARTSGAFDEVRDVALATALANALYPVLHLYREVTYGDYKVLP